MDQLEIDRFGRELYEALRALRTVPPLTGRVAGITIDDAYRISRSMLALRLAEGERIVGKKIGVTGLVVQKMLDVHQPDFGFLTDAMVCAGGASGGVPEMKISGRLIQPKAEGELAFVLARPLRGPGVTGPDVLAATASICPCFEVVDSRIDDCKIRIEDTVADNASSGLFILGDAVPMNGSPEGASGLDLSKIVMEVTKNGAPLSRGTGAASAIGSPEGCVAWLANTLGAFGIGLEAGEVILSGSLVPLEPVRAGDEMRAEIAGLGAVAVRFV